MWGSCVGSCVFCASLHRYIGQHIDWHIGRVSSNLLDRYSMLTNTQPIYRSTCVGWHINWKINRDIGRYLDRHLADISVNMPTKSCRSTVGQHVDRWPTDILPIPHCYLCTGDCNVSCRHNLTLVSDFCWAAQIYLIYPPFLRGFFV